MTPYYPANRRYRQKAIARFTLDVNRNTEADLLEWLQGQHNKTGYIKGLIRADMERRKGGGNSKAEQ